MKKTCPECLSEFEARYRAICCSDECKRQRKQNQNKTYLKDQRTCDPIRKKRALKPEKELVESMVILHRAAPKHDGDILKSRRIKSPNINKMPFRIHVPEMRSTYYFENEDKYQRFLTRQK